MEFPSCLPRGWLGDEAFLPAPPCSCGLTGAPFEFHRPGCDRSTCPYLDEESLALVAEAAASLVGLRGSVTGDAGAVLAVLTSLIAEGQAQLPDAVADARDQGFTWSEIASRLAVGASTVRHRYGHYATWRAALAVVGG